MNGPSEDISHKPKLIYNIRNGIREKSMEVRTNKRSGVKCTKDEEEKDRTIYPATGGIAHTKFSPMWRIWYSFTSFSQNFAPSPVYSLACPCVLELLSGTVSCSYQLDFVLVCVYGLKIQKVKRVKQKKHWLLSLPNDELWEFWFSVSNSHMKYVLLEYTRRETCNVSK